MCSVPSRGAAGCGTRSSHRRATAPPSGEESLLRQSADTLTLRVFLRLERIRFLRSEEEEYLIIRIFPVLADHTRCYCTPIMCIFPIMPLFFHEVFTA